MNDLIWFALGLIAGVGFSVCGVLVGVYRNWNELFSPSESLREEQGIRHDVVKGPKFLGDVIPRKSAEQSIVEFFGGTPEVKEGEEEEEELEAGDEYYL